MSTLGVVFLGIIALSSVVQAAFLVSLALEGRRLGRRLAAVERRLESELSPTLKNIAHVTDNLAEIAGLLRRQTLRIDAFVSDTLEKLEDTTDLLRRAVRRPLSTLLDITALLKGVRKGLDIYRRLGEADSPRHYSDDEHLFI